MKSKNRKRFFSSIILISALLLLASLSTVAGTLEVGANDPEFSSIQKAINSAKPGDTLLLKEGTYKENLKIEKDLTLKEKGPGNS